MHQSIAIGIEVNIYSNTKKIYIHETKTWTIHICNLNWEVFYSQKIALIDVGYDYRMTVLVTKVGGSIP